MVNYRTPEGKVVEGVMVYARLREVTWSLVSSTDDGELVVEDVDGDPVVLTPIPGTEQLASGPQIYAADDE